MLGMTEARVVIERDFAVQRDDVAFWCQDERVDFHQRGIFAVIGVPELDQDGHDLFERVALESCLSQDVARNVLVNAALRIQGNAGQCFGALLGEGFNVHAAFT